MSLRSEMDEVEEFALMSFALMVLGGYSAIFLTSDIQVSALRMLGVLCLFGFFCGLLVYVADTVPKLLESFETEDDS